MMSCLLRLLAWLLLVSPAAAQEVRIAVGSAFTTLDPHFHNLIPNAALSQHLFDRLLEPDAGMRPTPGLAAEWRAISPTAWEFRLRPGVRFHDGTPFTADDVAFTFQRASSVPDSPSSFAYFTRPVLRVVVIDPLTLRFETDGPAPLLPALLQGLPIVGRRQAEGRTTADFNAGRAAIGTGPYRLVSFVPGEAAIFAGNEDWHGGRPIWSRVSYRFIGQDMARLAALRAGDVDLIDQVPTSDVGEVSRDIRLALFARPGLRVLYLSLDGFRDVTPFVADLQGRPLPANPLADHRVRQALSLAIDRAGIVAQVMDGQGVPAGQFAPAGAVGYDPALAPDRFDPAEARLLLAEAGYPQGFSLVLNGPNDRYVNDARILQAVAQMWARVGVRTRVEAQPSAAYFGRVVPRREFSAALLGWGTTTGEPDSPLANILATYEPARGRGAYNAVRWSSPGFDTALDRALATFDLTGREAAYRDAMAIAMRDRPLLPLHHQVNVWAARRGFVFEPRADEVTTAMGLRPVP